jgi:hypothetical protein
MSLLRKIGMYAGVAGLAALSLCNCSARAPKNQNPSTDYKIGIENITAEFGELEKTLTQITDVQDGSMDFGQNGRSFHYKFVKVKGGDKPAGLLLLYPWPKYFEKYAPVEISFKRIKGSKISAHKFVKQYTKKGWYFSDNLNYIIEADGIIEPDGVKYLGEGK